MGLLHIGPFPTCLLPSRFLITPQSSSANALLSGMFSSPPSGLPLAPGPSLWFPLGTTSSVPAALSRHDVVMPPRTLPGLWRTLWEPDEAQGMGSIKVTCYVPGSWDLSPVLLRATHLQQSPVGKRDRQEVIYLVMPPNLSFLLSEPLYP